jgi:hypothetical protein
MVAMADDLISVLRVTTRCRDTDELVRAFARQIDDDSLVIRAQNPRDIGVRPAFALALADGTVVMRGHAEVIPSPGGKICLRFLDLDPRGLALRDRILGRPGAPLVAKRDPGPFLTVRMPSMFPDGTSEEDLEGDAAEPLEPVELDVVVQPAPSAVDEIPLIEAELIAAEPTAPVRVPAAMAQVAVTGLAAPVPRSRTGTVPMYPGPTPAIATPRAPTTPPGLTAAARAVDPPSRSLPTKRMPSLDVRPAPRASTSPAPGWWRRDRERSFAILTAVGVAAISIGIALAAGVDPTASVRTSAAAIEAEPAPVPAPAAAIVAPAPAPAPAPTLDPALATAALSLSATAAAQRAPLPAGMVQLTTAVPAGAKITISVAERGRRTVTRRVAPRADLALELPRGARARR